MFPASGNRNNNSGTTINNVGSNGNCWSSSANSDTNARNLNLNSSGCNVNNNERANGFTVRPVQAITTSFNTSHRFRIPYLSFLLFHSFSFFTFLALLQIG